MFRFQIEANSKYVNERRNTALENGTVTLADKKSHRVLQVQMQTTKPNPPISTYATEYFKVNQKAQVKSQRPAMETREERLIPKPSAAKNQKRSKNGVSFDKPMFETDSEDDDDNEDDPFATKFDTDVSPKENNAKKNNKRKNIEEDDDEDDGEEEVPTKPLKKKKKKGKGKKKSTVELKDVNDAGDELVDFELSD